MAIYKVKYGQSIYDIATQEYGSILGIANILRDNQSINLATDLVEGMEITINATSDTTISQDIANFFSNKTITNTNTTNGLLNLLGGYSYGEILTQNIDGETYINTIIREKDGQIHLNNREGGAAVNFDRVIFSEQFSVNDDGDELEISLNYEDFSPSFTIWIPLGNSINKIVSLAILDTGHIRMYDQLGNTIIHSSVTTQSNRDINIKIRCEVSATKDYYLDVDGVEDSALDVGNSSFSVNMIGGSIKNSVEGFNGDIKYFRYNNSKYRFGEGEGKHIFKNTI